MSPTHRARAARIATTLASVALAAGIITATVSITQLQGELDTATAELADQTTVRDEQAEDLRTLTAFEAALTVKADKLGAAIASTDGFLK